MNDHDCCGCAKGENEALRRAITEACPGVPVGIFAKLTVIRERSDAFTYLRLMRPSWDAMYEALVRLRADKRIDAAAFVDLTDEALRAADAFHSKRQGK